MSWQRGKAYAQDLRDRVLPAPGRLREVAERFGVSQAYVSRVRSRHVRLNQTCESGQHNHVPLRLAGLNEPLAGAKSLWCPSRRWPSCASNHGQDLGPVWAEAKKKTVHAAGQKKSGVAQARADWAAG